MTHRFPDPSEQKKRRLLQELLEAGLVSIVIDSSKAGVNLPKHLMGQEEVVLNLSRRFGLDVFEIGPIEVVASLSFAGERHRCVIPYRAMYAYLGKGEDNRYIFQDDLPAGLVKDAGNPRTDDEPDVPPPTDPQPPGLRLIK